MPTDTKAIDTKATYSQSLNPSLDEPPTLKPSLSELTTLKPSLSQTWVVVEKSKTDPEVTIDCSENK